MNIGVELKVPLFFCQKAGNWNKNAVGSIIKPVKKVEI